MEFDEQANVIRLTEHEVRDLDLSPEESEWPAAMVDALVPHLEDAIRRNANIDPSQLPYGSQKNRLLSEREARASRLQQLLGDVAVYAGENIADKAAIFLRYRSEQQ